jgi:hypothetical protein
MARLLAAGLGVMLVLACGGSPRQCTASLVIDFGSFQIVFTH